MANKFSIDIAFLVFALTDFQSLHFSFIHSFFDFFRSFVRVCWSDKFHQTEHHTDLVITSTCMDRYLCVYISNNIPLKLLRFTKALGPPAKNGPSRQTELPNNLTLLQKNVFSCSRSNLVYTALF